MSSTFFSKLATDVLLCVLDILKPDTVDNSWFQIQLGLRLGLGLGLKIRFIYEITLTRKFQGGDQRDGVSYSSTCWKFWSTEMSLLASVSVQASSSSTKSVCT